MSGESALPFVSPNFSLHFPRGEVPTAKHISSDAPWTLESFRYNWEKVTSARASRGQLTVFALIQAHIILKRWVYWDRQVQRKKSYLYNCDNIVLTRFHRTGREKKILVNLCRNVFVIGRTEENRNKKFIVRDILDLLSEGCSKEDVVQPDTGCES